jgi:hypothetical protein
VIYISFYINFLDKNSLKIDYYGKKITLPWLSNNYMTKFGAIAQ